MNQTPDKISELLKKAEQISRKQQELENELNSLKQEIRSLDDQPGSPEPAQANKTTTEPVPSSAFQEMIAKSNSRQENSQRKPRFDFNMEEFIGGNLINKIGILILIIGVGIGAKFAIDKDLISPVMRIVLGYLIGGGLLGLAYYLKPNYKTFSAVLLSGSVSILYFITFFAYSVCGLIPQTPSFILMALLTAFTVFAALQYEIEIIALFGLVGAYAVPFLLSDGSGKVVILFSYMAVINVGILVIAFKKYWKILNYSSFVFTWLIFGSWYGFESKPEIHFAISFIFAALFYFIFYITFLAYKLIRKEMFEPISISMLLSNSFIFYGIGYDLLSGNSYTHLLGLFTVLNGACHFLAAYAINKNKSVDRNIFYLVTGLVLVFITIAIPVQLDGEWVTLMWVGESALLFWIGKDKQIAFYERLSYPLMILGFISLFMDWNNISSLGIYSNPEKSITPVFNIGFFTSLFSLCLYGFINWLKSKHKNGTTVSGNSNLNALIDLIPPVLLGLTLYGTGWNEIELYWNQLYHAASPNYNSLINNYLDDISYFKWIWIKIYSFVLLAGFAFFVREKLKTRNSILVSATLSALFILIYFSSGLRPLDELRITYQNPYDPSVYQPGVFNVLVRYLADLIIAVLIWTTSSFKKTNLLSDKDKLYLDTGIHLSLLALVTFEWQNAMLLMGYDAAADWGISIVWGVYGLALISTGIFRKIRHLRILAIVLFAVTLLKLFVYDLSNFSTISKTIILILLGILLLTVSFLYNKFKSVILGNDKPDGH